MKHDYLVLKHILLLFIAFSSMNYVYAQSQTVSGRIISAEDDSPIPGVNVSVKGTPIGSVTDINGDYNILADDDAILVFSSVGFLTEEVLVGSKSVIDIALEADIKSLSEVVVVGMDLSEKQTSPQLYQLSAWKILGMSLLQMLPGYCKDRLQACW